MWRISWSSLKSNRARYVASAIAVIAGVAFLTAGAVLGASAVSALRGDVDRRYAAVDAAVVAPRDTAATGIAVTAETLDAIAALDGVAGVAGELSGPTGFIDDGGLRRRTGRVWPADEQLNPLDLVEGAAPVAADEVAIDRRTARDGDLAVGDRILVAGASGATNMTISGITRFGDNDRLDADGTLSFAPETAVTILNGGVDAYSEVLVRADGGSSRDLVAAIRELAPPTMEVVDGATFRDRKADEAGGFARLLGPALQAFALVALFVCGFVIVNTFSVVVGQRRRELALLRAVGATARQVKRMLAVEALLLGLIASALGVALGVGLSTGLQALLRAFDLPVPASGVVVGGAVVVRGILVGTVITYLAGLLPARRAGRTLPIEAMTAAQLPAARVPRGRRIAGIVLFALAALLLGAGAVATQPAVVGVGAAVAVVGVFIGGPLLAVGFTRLARPLLERAGVPGRLAGDNLVRNPVRTATTANALFIGILLVTIVSVAGATLRDWTVGQVNQLASADFIVAAGVGGIPEALVGDLQGLDGVRTVATVRSTPVRIGEETAMVSTGDLDDLRDAAGLRTTEGDLAELARPGTVAVPSFAAPGSDSGPARIGDVLAGRTATGTEFELEVVAILDFGIDTAALDRVVGAETFATTFGAPEPSIAFVRVEDGRFDEISTAIEDLTTPYGTVTVLEGNFFARIIGSVFDFLINAVNGLLGMSIVIALIGIVNTLSLAIFERRREIGLLRAVGSTRSEVSRSILGESVCIAMLGTVVGIGLGLLIGAVLAVAIDEPSLTVTVEWTRMVVIAVLGIVIGTGSAWLPIRRVARLDLLEALRPT